MIPENRLSTSSVTSAFLGGRSSDLITKTLDYETGGVGISDASQGLQVQVWRGSLVGNDIILDVPSNIGVSPFTVYSGVGITEFSFTFDQLMRPLVVFVQEGSCKMYWYDTSIGGYAVTDYGVLVSSPKVSIDDKRKSFTSLSDVIFAYVEGNALYVRYQRDRYLQPHLLKSEVGTLLKIGMTTGLRLQFEL